MSWKWEDGDCLILVKDALVSHVVGSSPQKSKEGSWKNYWIVHSRRQWPWRCQIHGCGNEPEVGAHVYVKGLRQNFILPTCQECNKDPEQEYGDGDCWVSAKANALAVRVVRHSNTFE